MTGSVNSLSNMEKMPTVIVTSWISATMAPMANLSSRNQKRTRLIIVTVPEEMAVNEAIEYWEKARDELSIKLGPVIINQTFPDLFSEGEKEWVLTHPDPPPALSDLISLARARVRRRENQRFEINRLKEKLPVASCIEIPFVPLPHLNQDSLLDIGKTLIPTFLSSLGNAPCRGE